MTDLTPGYAVEDQAADALLGAIAKYKAAGWCKDAMIECVDNFWKSTERAEFPDAKMRPIPVHEASVLGRMYGWDQVIVYARKVDEFDGSALGGEHMTTYGVDPVHADVAAKIGDRLKFELMGWDRNTTTIHESAVHATPEPLTEEQKARLAKLHDPDFRDRAAVRDFKWDLVDMSDADISREIDEVQSRVDDEERWLEALCAERRIRKRNAAE